MQLSINEESFFNLRGYNLNPRGEGGQSRGQDETEHLSRENKAKLTQISPFHLHPGGGVGGGGDAHHQASTQAGLKIKESNLQAGLKGLFYAIFRWLAGLILPVSNLLFGIKPAYDEA